MAQTDPATAYSMYHQPRPPSSPSSPLFDHHAATVGMGGAAISGGGEDDPSSAASMPFMGFRRVKPLPRSKRRRTDVTGRPPSVPPPPLPHHHFTTGGDARDDGEDQHQYDQQQQGQRYPYRMPAYGRPAMGADPGSGPGPGIPMLVPGGGGAYPNIPNYPAYYPSHFAQVSIPTMLGGLPSFPSLPSSLLSQISAEAGAGGVGEGEVQPQDQNSEGQEQGPGVPHDAENQSQSQQERERERQAQEEFLHRATTGFLASLEGLQLPGPDATAEELLRHAEMLSAKMRASYGGFMGQGLVGHPGQGQGQVQGMQFPFPPLVPTLGMPPLPPLPPSHASGLAKPPLPPSSQGSQRSLEFPLGPSVTDGAATGGSPGDGQASEGGDKVVLPPLPPAPTPPHSASTTASSANIPQVPLARPLTYSQVQVLAQAQAQAQGQMQGPGQAQYGFGGLPPDAVEYLVKARMARMGMGDAMLAPGVPNYMPTVSGPAPSSGPFGHPGNAGNSGHGWERVERERDIEYSSHRTGPNNNKKRKVPANVHGRMLAGRPSWENDMVNLDFGGNGNGNGSGYEGGAGGYGGLEAEIDELAAGMLGTLGAGPGEGTSAGRMNGRRMGRGQRRPDYDEDDEDPDGRGIYDRPVTPSGAGSGSGQGGPREGVIPYLGDGKASSLTLLIEAKKRGKMAAATFAGMQRKELVRSRRRELAASLGPPPPGPTMVAGTGAMTGPGSKATVTTTTGSGITNQGIPPPPLHPSKGNTNIPPPPHPVPKSDAILAIEQALLTACLRPLVNSSLAKSGTHPAGAGSAGKKSVVLLNEKGEKMRLSKRRCVRLGRLARRVPRHPDQMPFPVLKAFGYRCESAAGERAVATKEETVILRNQFEGELARQANKAATKGGSASKSHHPSNSVSGTSAKGASPRKGPKSKKAQRAAANAARNVTGGLGTSEEAKFIDPISGETTNVMPGTLPPPATVGSGTLAPGKATSSMISAGSSKPTAGHGAAAIPPTPTLGGKQSPTPTTTSSKKKKKRSALANASNPHHLRNYVPSRLPASAGGGHTGAAGDGLGWPLPLRFLSAEIPRKKGSSNSDTTASGQGQGNTDGSGLPLTNPGDEWICAYCEYALFYGGSKEGGGSYKKAVKNRKKILKRRRRARERAALAASGKGGVKPVERSQEGNEDDWDGAKGYEEGPGKDVAAATGGGGAKGRGPGGGGRGDQGGYG